MKRILFIFVISFFFMSLKSDITFVLPTVITNGLVVGTVKASDEDNLNNPTFQKLKFTIVSGNTNTSFKIGAYTGTLTINNASYIKSRTKKYFQLVIKVADNGVPAKSAQATVTIITAK